MLYVRYFLIRMHIPNYFIIQNVTKIYGLFNLNYNININQADGNAHRIRVCIREAYCIRYELSY